MRRAIACSMLVCFLFGVYLAAGCTPKDEKELRLTVTGYLVCQNCGAYSHCPMGGIDLGNHPEDYTLACASMPECIVSGYGLMIDQDDAKWSGAHTDSGSYIFYPFDYAGSKLALDEIIYKSKRANHLLVEVQGSVDRTGGEMHVEGIREK